MHTLTARFDSGAISGTVIETRPAMHPDRPGRLDYLLAYVGSDGQLDRVWVTERQLAQASPAMLM